MARDRCEVRAAREHGRQDRQPIGDSHPKMVLLMCGFNSLAHHETQADCLADYESLLAAVRSHLQPESTVVLSLIPLPESAKDLGNHQLNVEINEFNTKLAACCREHAVQFLNVNSAVAGPNASPKVISGNQAARKPRSSARMP